MQEKNKDFIHNKHEHSFVYIYSQKYYLQMCLFGELSEEALPADV